MTQPKQPEPKQTDGELAETDLDGVNGGAMSGISLLVQVSQAKADAANEDALRPAHRPLSKKRD